MVTARGETSSTNRRMNQLWSLMGAWSDAGPSAEWREWEVEVATAIPMLENVRRGFSLE